MKHGILKILALVCALVLLALPAMAEGLNICIVTTTGVDDGNFNEDCYRGIQTFLANHPDCKVTDIKEPDLAQIVPAVEKVVGDYDAFVLPGFYFAAIGEIVQNNPDVHFIVVDTPVQDDEGNPLSADNLYTMSFKEQEGGFFAGLAAAFSTKTGKVAVVTGMPFPTNIRYQYGFMAGVNYANAKYGTSVQAVELPSYAGTDMAGNDVGGNYVGSFGDEAAGKVLGETLINEGCDVLFAAAGSSGNGVLTAVKEAKDVWFVGCDVDQYRDGVNGDANVVLTSALKVMHSNVDKQLEAIYTGTFKGEDALLGADTDSTGYVSEAGHQQLSEDALVKLAECYEKLKAGEIVPPTDTEYSPTDFPGLN